MWTSLVLVVSPRDQEEGGGHLCWWTPVPRDLEEGGGHLWYWSPVLGIGKREVVISTGGLHSLGIGKRGVDISGIGRQS